VALPLWVKGWFEPLAVAGSVIVDPALAPGDAPVTKRFSTKIDAPADVGVATPSPARTSHTTRAQVPLPSHTVPPFWLHAVPDARFGFDGVPFVHTSPVH